MWPFTRKIKRFEPTGDELADVIDRAANIMEDNGHTTGKLWENNGKVYPGGPVCLSGAFLLAVGHNEQARSIRVLETIPAARAVANELSPTSGIASVFFRLYTFNDSERRPGAKNRIVSRLRKIANSLRTPPMTNIVEVADTQNDVELAGGTE